jgi:diketogulonate reductase-like aldo/keto reductase
MEKLKQEGLAKSVGLSNYMLEQLQETLEDAEVSCLLANNVRFALFSPHDARLPPLSTRSSSTLTSIPKSNRLSNCVTQRELPSSVMVRFHLSRKAREDL